VRGRLLCVCGKEDALIPPRDVAALDQALSAANAGRQSSGQGLHRLLLVPGGHGFLCDQRTDHHPVSAALAWAEMLKFFGESLG
jgi:carboxymethylenebutenolidase